MSKQTVGKDKAKAGDKAGKAAPVTKTIALNKRARHEYHLEQRHEAGLALQGWELKSIRAGRANIIDGYALVQHGELFLIGAQFTPLIQASTHVVANDRRTRKLLLLRNILGPGDLSAFFRGFRFLTRSNLRQHLFGAIFAASVGVLSIALLGLAAFQEVL